MENHQKPSLSSLNFHQQIEGAFFLAPNIDGKELICEPDHCYNTHNYAFDWVRNKLHQTGYIFKIHDDGRVMIIVPRGHKFGYLLGWIAWTYRQSRLIEEKNDD